MVDHLFISENILRVYQQIYYETLRKILPGEELSLGPKEPIVLDPSAADAAGSAEHSSPFGHQMADHSPLSGGGGHGADGSSSEGGLTKMDVLEEEDYEDDDTGVKCIKCDKIFQNYFM